MEKTKWKEPSCPKANTAPEGSQGFAKPAQIPSFLFLKIKQVKSLCSADNRAWLA